MRKRSLNTLQRSAARATRFRGHYMRWSTIHGESRSLRFGVCVHCEAQVTCNTRPMPNDISIGGDAVAVHCTRKDRS